MKLKSIIYFKTSQFSFYAEYYILTTLFIRFVLHFILFYEIIIVAQTVFNGVVESYSRGDPESIINYIMIIIVLIFNTISSVFFSH